MADQDKLNLSEHVETLFKGVEGVSEEQKIKMETVLEAAVSSIVSTEKAKIQEAADAQIAEQIESHATELEETVSKYLEYVISEWMEDNKLAVESGLQLEMATKFFDGMKALFVEHNVNVPEGAEDLVASHEAKIAELEDKLNESTNKVIEMGAQLDERARADVIATASTGLTDTQKEKFNGLVEGIEFSNTESFKLKVETIRESYFKPSESKPESLNEDVTGSQAEQKQIRTFSFANL